MTLTSHHATLTLSQYELAMSSYHTLYCIATHILTTLKTPVTSTPLLTNPSIVFKSPVTAASHIFLFSSYNNITDNNIMQDLIMQGLATPAVQLG